MRVQCSELHLVQTVFVWLASSLFFLWLKDKNKFVEYLSVCVCVSRDSWQRCEAVKLVFAWSLLQVSLTFDPFLLFSGAFSMPLEDVEWDKFARGQQEPGSPFNPCLKIFLVAYALIVPCLPVRVVWSEQVRLWRQKCRTAVRQVSFMKCASFSYTPSSPASM